MKKIFLIPLLACFSCVIAWADPVTTLEELQTALNAGGEVTLGSNINAEATAVTFSSGTAILDLGEYTLSSTISASSDAEKGGLVISGGSLTIKGNGSITAANGNAILVSGGALIVKSGTISGGNEGIFASGGSITIEGGTINGTGDNAIWSRGEAVTIKGGTLIGGWGAIQADNNVVLNITGGSLTGGDGYQDVYLNAWSTISNPNPICNVSGGTFNGPGFIVKGGSCTITGGTFAVNPYKYVGEGYLIAFLDPMYKVVPAEGVVAYNVIKAAVYDHLSDAVSAADTGDRLVMYASDNNALTISKNLTIEYGSYSINVSAGAGYTKIDNDQRIVITDNALAAYLQGDSSDPFIVSENNDLSKVGQIIVRGTKVLTVNENVTVTCAQQNAGNSIIIPNGASLTLKGNGNFISDRGLLEVLEGGTLVVGTADKSDQLHFVTTDKSIKNRVILNEGTATIYKADINAASGVIRNAGTMVIDGGSYVGKAAASAPEAAPSGQHCYAVNCLGSTTIRNAYVYGYHGGISPEEGASLKLENCDLRGRDYDGLYVCTRAIVSAYNTKFFTEKGGSNRSAYIGNNDAYNTFGLIYLYDGCVLKNRMCVQGKGDKEPEMYFPVTISTESEWYQVANNGGGVGPLPKGYVYYSILDNDGTKTGNDTINATDKKIYSHILFDAGYRWITVSTAEKQEEADDDPTATIPWQQSSTWDATKSETSTTEVPTDKTAVTIPEGKTVVISNDPAKNNGISEAVAEQVVLGGEGASLTVQDGTSLNVTNGVNIADGGKLVVDAGAMVTIGEGGLVAGNEEAVEVKMTEGKSGIFMITPDVKENTHPMAKVELVSKAYYITAEDRYVWQRFGVPAYMEGMTKANVDYDHVAYPTAWMKIEHQNWADFEDGDVFKPFTCYGLTTTATTAGAVYTFSCPLMGNGNAELNLEDNWNYYANSYTAPINIPQMLADFKATYPNVSGTVYLYRAYDNWWYELNNGAYEFGLDENDQPLPEQIAPMQAFIFQRRAAGENPVINYESQIWNPIMNPSTPAPARVRNFNKAMVVITAQDGTKDMVRLIEGNQFSTNFDNTYDATKYMKDNSFNLFANANNEKLGTIASDNLEGTMIGLNTKGQTSFTMTIKNANGMNYAIRDMLTGTETDIVDGATYMFSVPADTNVEDRFMIVAKAQAPTSIETIAADAATKGIYTMTGQFVGNDYYSLPNGIYVVDGKKVVK